MKWLNVLVTLMRCWLIPISFLIWTVPPPSINSPFPYLKLLHSDSVLLDPRWTTVKAQLVFCSPMIESNICIYGNSYLSEGFIIAGQLDLFWEQLEKLWRILFGNWDFYWNVSQHVHRISVGAERGCFHWMGNHNSEPPIGQSKEGKWLVIDW